MLLKFKSSLVLLATVITVQGVLAQTNRVSVPPFENVYKLLQENVSGITSEDLNAAAVRGLLAELEGRASLVTNSSPEIQTNLLSATTVFDNSYGYFRVSSVSKGLADKISDGFKLLSSTNKLKGVILDLRFANGSDYEAAGKTADLFLNTALPLVDWGAASVSSTAKTNAIAVPSAILINSRTRGAAEALAAVLRETRVGLLIGGKTSGQASVFKEFPLSNGQTLLIASSTVKVGSNKVLDVNGLKPDIQLDVSLGDERAFLEDPYRVISRQIEQVSLTLSTNQSSLETNRPRTRLNEAELVRRKREGLSIEEDFVDQPANFSELRVIRDPALARALDLLKGLAVIQAQRAR